MVPNHSYVPKRLFDTGLFNLKTEEGQGAFVDACVAALHGLDERWGHLKKKSGQSQLHGHGEDSALYLSDEPGQSQAVDFIGGAGGSNPQPSWSVDDPRYSESDWLDPFNHGVGTPTPPPAQPGFPYPDESTAVKAYEQRVKKSYNAVQRKFPDEADSSAFRHFSRYGFSARGMPEPDAANKHIAELRAELGAPPE